MPTVQVWDPLAATSDILLPTIRAVLPEPSASVVSAHVPTAREMALESAREVSQGAVKATVAYDDRMILAATCAASSDCISATGSNASYCSNGFCFTPSTSESTQCARKNRGRRLTKALTRRQRYTAWKPLRQPRTFDHGRSRMRNWSGLLWQCVLGFSRHGRQQLRRCRQRLPGSCEWTSIVHERRVWHQVQHRLPA